MHYGDLTDATNLIRIFFTLVSEYDKIAYFESMEALQMKSYTAVIEKCPETGVYIGFVPGFSGAHSQGKTLDELHHNLREVIEMLLEDGEPRLEAEFVGTQNVLVA